MLLQKNVNSTSLNARSLNARSLNVRSLNERFLQGVCVLLQIITSAAEMQQTTLQYRREGKRVGVVPTMGFLHAGHASLIRKARECSDIVITTIFVNPLQFAANEDLTRYPRDLERDKQIAEESGADILFTPTPEEMYPGGFGVNVSVQSVTAPFEGVFRPTHFDGVATVVAKLLNLTQPNTAFFGQKDYQQCMVVKKMVRDLAMPHEIIICPTERESDGLAMSSRNVFLSPEDRTNATVLYKALQSAESLIREGNRSRVAIEARMQEVLTTIPHLKQDYAAAADSETLAQPNTFPPERAIVLLLALRLGSTRLIDNLVVDA
jgi:pantoate--beta-alanine ligase